MSLPRETMLELMALADGELEGEARSRAEALVASNAEARAIVGELRRAQLGDWVRESMGERAAAADGIADGVMARIGVPAARAASGRTAAGNGARRVVRPRAWIAAGALVLAAAAAIALYVRGTAPSAIARAPKGSEPAGGAESSGSALAIGVEVDEIDAPARGVSVFEIPAAEGAAAAGMAHRPSSVVVWIDDPPGGR